MFVLGRDIVYDRSTACARDVPCEKTFSEEITKYPSNVPFVLNSKARIISTVLQYHSSLETAGKSLSLFSTARIDVVRDITLFFISRRS